MKSTYLYAIVALIGLGAIYFFFRSGSANENEILTTSVKQGTFEIHVNATGELKAKKSTKIMGPQSMRSVGIWQTNITDIIPEGTMVRKGDYVASLDKTELASKMQDLQSEIEKIETQLEQAKIDTAIDMKEIRDQIANLEFSMEQEKLEIEKNRYEPEMIIEQSRLKLQKSQRDYAQMNNKLELKKIQSDAKIGEFNANLRQQQNKLANLSGVAAQFTISAPEDGMLVYQRTWNGKKGPGSQVSGWDPVVGELPDLSDMISVIFVNEVDISKVKKGQEVSIKIDAFPEKEFDGYISNVANIGQQLRNQDAKVFEVTVQLSKIDSVLRPAMTTSNEILVYSYENVLSVPLEAYQKDSLEFVIKKVNNRYIRQEVVGDAANEDAIIIAAGLEFGDQVCLTTPENGAELPIEYLDETLKKETLEKLTIVHVDRAKKEREDAAKVKDEYVQNRTVSSGNVIIIN